MNPISVATHKFCRGRVPGDGTCLFWSILLIFQLLLVDILSENLTNTCLMAILTGHLLNKHLTKVLNQGLFDVYWMAILNRKIRDKVAKYILHNRETYDIILHDSDYETLEEYCNALKQGELWSGNGELKALSDLYNVVIGVIHVSKSHANRSVHTVSFVPENGSTNQCVFVLYDSEQSGCEHYDPLYVVNLQDSNEKETIFERNDETVKELLKKFIREDLGYSGDVKLDFIGHTVTENAPTAVDEVTQSSVANSSMKRKTPEIDHILSALNNNIQIPIQILNEYYEPHKRVKTSTDAVSTYRENNNESTTTDIRIHTERSANELDLPVNQQHAEDLSVVSDEQPEEEKKDLESN